MLIRELYENEMDGAIDLAWHVFLEFEALDYSEQGVKEFWKSIHDEAYLNQLRIYGAFEDEKILGIIATRNEGGHVALFFVDGKYQRQGIGKDLFALVCKENTSGSITVNSSPFCNSCLSPSWIYRYRFGKGYEWIKVYTNGYQS